MSAVYDLLKPDERLRLVLSAPTKYRRRGLIEVIRRDYGATEAARIEARLHEIAERTAA